MRSLGILFLFLGLLLGACSGEWVKPDASAAQSDRDQMECNRWAAREAGLRAEGFYGPGHYPHRYGPGPAMDPWGYRARDEAYLADYCMRANGYQRAPRN